MGPFLTLREMWQEAYRRRRLIVVVLGLAILAGLLVAFRPGFPPQSRQYEVWQASADILVDTSDSQVVDARGSDFLTLATRTSLLGNLIATDPLKTGIATAAGVQADRLVVVPPANTVTVAGGVPLDPTPVTTAASREIPDADATVLGVSTDATLPILRVTAQAPDASIANRLVTGTIAQLKRYLNSVAAREQIPAARKLVVRQLAVPTPAPETRGTPRLAGLAVAILVALLGCAAVAGAPMFVRRWKQAGEAAIQPAPTEREPESPLPFDRAAHREEAADDTAALAEASVAAGPVATVSKSDQSNRHRQQVRDQPERSPGVA